MSGRGRTEGPRFERYDPELPFLYELEHEVRRRAERAARARSDPRSHTASGRAAQGTTGHAQRASRPPTRRRGAPHPGPVRVARRSLTLVALLCLIGASAYGARQALSGGAPNPTIVHQGAFVLVDAGHAGADTWSLRLYTRGDDLCRVLAVAESESSRCAPAPGPRALAATSAVSPLRRYVFGVAGEQVARVAVRVGAATVTVSTHAPNPARARAGGLPAATRWFVAVLPRPAGESVPPALVRGLDAAGRPTGPARIDCAETGQPQPCPS